VIPQKCRRHARAFALTDVRSRLGEEEQHAGEHRDRRSDRCRRAFVASVIGVLLIVCGTSSCD
jgi:hypothetical protein